MVFLKGNQEYETVVSVCRPPPRPFVPFGDERAFCLSPFPPGIRAKKRRTVGVCSSKGNVPEGFWVPGLPFVCRAEGEAACPRGALLFKHCFSSPAGRKQHGTSYGEPSRSLFPWGDKRDESLLVPGGTKRSPGGQAACPPGKPQPLPLGDTSASVPRGRAPAAFRRSSPSYFPRGDLCPLKSHRGFLSSSSLKKRISPGLSVFFVP